MLVSFIALHHSTCTSWKQREQKRRVGPVASLQSSMYASMLGMRARMAQEANSGGAIASPTLVEYERGAQDAAASASESTGQSTSRSRAGMLLWSMRENAASDPSLYRAEYEDEVDSEPSSDSRRDTISVSSWRPKTQGGAYADIFDGETPNELDANAFTVDMIADCHRQSHRRTAGANPDQYNPFADGEQYETLFGDAAELRALPTNSAHAKLQGIIETEHWENAGDAFMQLIDVNRMRGLLKLSGYRERCGQVIHAAVNLIKSVGVENVVLLQLTPQSTVDHQGMLRGYTVVVRQEANVAPILETMPDYGAGRAVLSAMDPAVHKKHKSGVPFEAARDTITGLIRSRSVVDFSNPTTEELRREAHAFLYALKQGGHDALAVVPKSLGHGLPAVDAESYRGAAKATDRLRTLQLHSLGKYNCSIAVCENETDPTLVCDNYAQITADLIDHACRTNEFTTVSQFLESPLSTLAMEHSAATRAAVLARVAETFADGESCSSHTPARVSYCVRHSPGDDHEWYAEPSIPARDLTDHAHCTIRGLTNDSAEWRAVLQYALEELAFLENTGVHDARRREMLAMPGSAFAIVFNNVTDPVFRSKTLQQHTQRPSAGVHSFSIDLGHSVGYSVFQKTTPFAFNDMLLGVPHAGVMPHNAPILKTLLKEDKKRYALDRVGYFGSFDPLEALPLRAAARRNPAAVQRLFPHENEDRPAVVQFLALHKLLNRQFVESMPQNSDYITLEQTHLVIFKWCSAIDESLLSLKKRVKLAGHLDIIKIDARHKRQVREVMELITESLSSISADDRLFAQLQSIFQPGTRTVNPSGVVLNIPTELAERLLSNWSTAF